jgi:zinc transporter ZupT
MLQHNCKNMDIYLYSLIAGATIVGISAIGIITALSALNTRILRALPLLVTFSAGVFIVLVVHLVAESIELLGNPTLVALCAVAGAGIILGIARIIPESHHHHSADEAHHTHSPAGAKRMLAGDALHNIADGLLLVPAFAVDISVGIATTIGIGLHEAVQELSEFFVLRAAGFSVRAALIKNALVGCTIFIGIGMGFLITGDTDTVVGVILAAAAGAFAFIVIEDLVPRSIKTARLTLSVGPHLGAFVLGIATMAVVQLSMAHEHEHGPEETEHHAHEETAEIH